MPFCAKIKVLGWLFRTLCYYIIFGYKNFPIFVGKLYYNRRVPTFRQILTTKYTNDVY